MNSGLEYTNVKKKAKRTGNLCGVLRKALLQ